MYNSMSTLKVLIKCLGIKSILAILGFVSMSIGINALISRLT